MKVETTTGRPSEGLHWYDRSGNPVYEVRGANGQLRAPTLRDARKFGWLPGVSSILAMEAKPMLERWKIEQAIMAALTLSRLPNESEDAFMVRVREDSQAQAKKAAARGTEIHALIQGAFENRPYPLECAPFVEPLRKYVSERYGLHDWQAERSFAHYLGYGGKSDLANKQVVIDIKCKEFDETKSAEQLAYPEHCMQLVAYAQGLDIPRPECLNIFVSTLIPGLIRVRQWEEWEMADGREAFSLLLRLWKIRRQYDGAFKLEEVA